LWNIVPEKIKGVEQARKEAAYMKALKKYWTSKESFIFPIHWANNHWFVVRGDWVRGRWEVYDSITNEDATRIVVQVPWHLHFSLSMANTHAEFAKISVDAWSWCRLPPMGNAANGGIAAA
jgi:Ulp1 protease family, C-terminal catalytic domain